MLDPWRRRRIVRLSLVYDFRRDARETIRAERHHGAAALGLLFRPDERWFATTLAAAAEFQRVEQHVVHPR